MGMVVKVDADIDSGNPAENHSRSQHKGCAGPRAGDASNLGMKVDPERGSIGGEADNVEEDAVPVLRVGEKTTGLQNCRRRDGAGLRDQSDLRAVAMAMTVTPRLTQGPQSAAPAMITIANNGKKDLPKTRADRETNSRVRGRMLYSFPLRLGWGVV